MKKTEQCRRILQLGKEKAVAEEKPFGVDHVLVALIEWFEEGNSEEDSESSKATARDTMGVNMIGTVTRMLDRMDAITRHTTLKWLVERFGYRLKGRGLKG